jgi:hypothetical protein
LGWVDAQLCLWSIEILTAKAMAEALEAAMAAE